MWQIIVAGVSAGAAALGAAYKLYSDRQASLGSFVIWGRPNSGKTTFISQMRGDYHRSPEKKTTTSRTQYKNVKLQLSPTCIVNSIVDMPGTNDRLENWRELVAENNHVFYLINLSRSGDAAYLAQVRNDLKETVKAVLASPRSRKRINIIASHVDQSQWKDADASQVNNSLQEDETIRRIYESLEGVKGYIYSANLTDATSFRRLMQSIANDLKA